MGKGEPTLPGAGISQGSNNARAQGSNEVYQQGQGLMPGAYTPNDYRQQQQYGGDYYDSQGAAYNYGQQQEGGFLQTGYQAGLRNQQQNFYLQQQQQQSPQQQLLQQIFAVLAPLRGLQQPEPSVSCAHGISIINYL